MTQEAFCYRFVRYAIAARDRTTARDPTRGQRRFECCIGDAGNRNARSGSPPRIARYTPSGNDLSAATRFLRSTARRAAQACPNHRENPHRGGENCSRCLRRSRCKNDPWINSDYRAEMHVSWPSMWPTSTLRLDPQNAHCFWRVALARYRRALSVT
jgi:hypothetical protein